MKRQLSDLALFGAKPEFDEPLHVGRPNLGPSAEILQRVEEILNRRWLTNDGPNVIEFERRIAELVGVNHCIAMCNGTIALEIAVRALGLTGEVIVPSMTFIATAHALQWQEISPVFADIDPKSFTLHPDSVERMITPKTSGIIGVHLFGRPCNTDALEEIARRRNLTLIYDASHAFGCSHGSRMIGNFGRAEIFSFHATKFVNSLEGGAIVTDDAELAGKVRLMRNFGFSGYDCVSYIGTNGKMNEVSAAVGLSSLENMVDFIHANRKNYNCYRDQLAEIPGLQLMTYNESEQRNYQYIVVIVDESEAGLSRDQLMQVLHAENILARRYFYPGCHKMEPYRSLRRTEGTLLPETENFAQRVLLLPTGTAIDLEQIVSIGRIITLALQNPCQIVANLGATAEGKTIQPG